MRIRYNDMSQRQVVVLQVNSKLIPRLFYRRLLPSPSHSFIYIYDSKVEKLNFWNFEIFDSQ